MGLKEKIMGGNGDTPKQDFPRTYNKCPNCGSERRIVSVIVADMIENGKANKSFNAYLSMQNTIIKDPTRTVLSFPVLTTVEDACYDCGTRYVVAATVQMGMEKL